MDRPGSRGGMQSRSGLRTGALRTGGNGGGQVNYSGVGLNTNVSVAERPVTQHGMGGMRVATAGPKRQVQDTSFFISLLRTKCTEINTEIAKLKKDHEKSQADNSSYLKYERQYEDLIKLVRNLEGKLADYNLAMDKSRDSTDPEDVRAFQEQLAQRNKSEKRQVDAIFLERQSCEEAVRAHEEKLAKIRQMEEYKVSQLNDADREKYHKLANTNAQLTKNLSGRRNELENIKKRVMQGEMALENDHIREGYNSLRKQLESLSREKENLETELEASKLDPAEAKARMLEKVKADNQKIQNMKKSVEEAQKEAEEKRDHLAELTSEFHDRKSGSGNESGKYEVLFQRDLEMTRFLDSFEENTIRELEEQKRAQKLIVGLLEHTSRHIMRENNMPDQDQFAAMQNSLTFKKRQLESSLTTQEQLERELEQRKGELEKINTLDVKIGVELESLTSRIEVMKSEMIQFVKIDELREQADETRELLLGLKKEYQHRREQIRAQVSQVASKNEKRKSMLADNETARMIEGLEQKLRHYEQTIFHLNEFIIEKELETDFQSEREACGRCIDELNAFHIEEATNQAV